MKSRAEGGDQDVVGTANRLANVRAGPHREQMETSLGHLSRSFAVAVHGDAPAGAGGVVWLVAGGRSADHAASQTRPPPGIHGRHTFAEAIDSDADATWIHFLPSLSWVHRAT